MLFFFFLAAITLFQQKENQQKSKMGAEKLSVMIVVVGQVQSAKAVKNVTKAAPAINQLIVSTNT